MLSTTQDLIRVLNYKATEDQWAQLSPCNDQSVLNRLCPTLLKKMIACEHHVCVYEFPGDMACAYCASNGCETAIHIYLGNEYDAAEFNSVWVHELVHADQYASGRLVYKDLTSPVLTWEGKECTSITVPMFTPINAAGEILHFVSLLKYYSQPWELEAQVPAMALNDGVEINDMLRKIYRELNTFWKPHFDTERVICRGVEIGFVGAVLEEANR